MATKWESNEPQRERDEEPIHVVPPESPLARTIDALDLSDFRDLTNAAMAARNKAAGLQQSLQEAQVAQLKAEGAWEGELMRLRRRYGLAEDEGFDSETGEIGVVRQA